MTMKNHKTVQDSFNVVNKAAPAQPNKYAHLDDFVGLHTSRSGQSALNKMHPKK